MVVKARFASYAVATLVVSASAAHAQVVDFSRIPGVQSQPTVQIDLGAAMLSFVTSTARAADPTFADALAGLERVRVFVYSSREDNNALSSFVDDSAARLERAGWERTVLAEEGNSKVRVHTKVNDTKLAGLTMMVLEGEKEAVFIEVAGNIDPAQLGRVMTQFGVPMAMGGIPGGFGALAPPTVFGVPAGTVPPAAPNAAAPNVPNAAVPPTTAPATAPATQNPPR